MIRSYEILTSPKRQQGSIPTVVPSLVFWASRSIILCSYLVVLIGLASGCSNFGQQQRAILIQASQLYSHGQITSASSQLDRLIADYRNAAEISEAYYLRGLCRAKVKQIQPAIEDFQKAVEKTNRPDIKARSLVSLGTLTYERGDWVQAAKWYEDALPRLADRPPKEEILFCCAVSLQRIGRWRESDKRFAKLLHKFRDRPIAAEARRLAAWRHPYYAIQIGAFRDSDNAAKVVYDWRERRLDAVQENLHRGGEALWVVMTGRYRTYAEAQAALARIREQVPGAYIIP